MANKSLTEIIEELVNADQVRLPIDPKVGQEVTSLLASEGPESGKLWSLVGRDPGLICSLFRAANSSFFAGLQKTLTIEDAVTRLGFRKAAQVIESACKAGQERSHGKLLQHYMPRLWRHSQACAVGARWLANRCGYQEMVEQVYLAGLLHDIGKQFLLAALEETSSRGELAVTLSEQLIQEVVSSMHVEQGLRLFEEWNLPEVYRDVVADHHLENLVSPSVMVALVKLANNGCRKVGLSLVHEADVVLPTTAEAQFLGVDEIVLAEFEIMLEDQFLGGKPFSEASGATPSQL